MDCAAGPPGSCGRSWRAPEFAQGQSSLRGSCVNGSEDSSSCVSDGDILSEEVCSWKPRFVATRWSWLLSDWMVWMLWSMLRIRSRLDHSRQELRCYRRREDTACSQDMAKDVGRGFNSIQFTPREPPQATGSTIVISVASSLHGAHSQVADRHCVEGCAHVTHSAVARRGMFIKDRVPCAYGPMRHCLVASSVDHRVVWCALLRTTLTGAAPKTGGEHRTEQPKIKPSSLPNPKRFLSWVTSLSWREPQLWTPVMLRPAPEQAVRLSTTDRTARSSAWR